MTSVLMLIILAYVIYSGKEILTNILEASEYKRKLKNLRF